MAPPLRPLRVLIEDRHLVEADVVSAAFPGVEITTCPGPCHDGECCPLVTDRACPYGTHDVVVSALDGPWSASVLAAWDATATPVVDARGLAVDDPSARLTHCVGAAIQRLWAPYR